MKCPVCQSALTAIRAGSVTVDVCLGGCGGIWFDNFELQKLDDPESLGGELLVNVKKRADLQIDPDQRRRCPKCDLVMMRHLYSPRRRVEVDECPSCGGYWLDAGELAAIREEFASEQEKRTAVESYVNEASARILESVQAQAGDQRIRTSRIGRVFQLSRPIQFRHE